MVVPPLASYRGEAYSESRFLTCSSGATCLQWKKENRCSNPNLYKDRNFLCNTQSSKTGPT